MDIYCDVCRYVINDAMMMYEAPHIYHKSCFTNFLKEGITPATKSQAGPDRKFCSIDRKEAEELYRSRGLLQSAGDVVIQPDGSIVPV